MTTITKKMFILCEAGMQLKEKDEAYVDMTWENDALHLYMYSLRGFSWSQTLENVPCELETGFDGVCVPFVQFCKAIKETKVKEGIQFHVGKAGLTVVSGSYSKTIPSSPGHGLKMNLGDTSDKILLKSFPIDSLKSFEDFKYTISKDLLEFSTMVHMRNYNNRLYFWATDGIALSMAKGVYTGKWGDTDKNFVQYSFSSSYLKNFQWMKWKENDISIQRKVKDSIEQITFSDGNIALSIPVEDTTTSNVIPLEEWMNFSPVWSDIDESMFELIPEIQKTMNDFKKDVRSKYSVSDKFGVGVRWTGNSWELFDAEDPSCTKTIPLSFAINTNCTFSLASHEMTWLLKVIKEYNLRKFFCIEHNNLITIGCLGDKPFNFFIHIAKN